MAYYMRTLALVFLFYSVFSISSVQARRGARFHNNSTRAVVHRGAAAKSNPYVFHFATYSTKPGNQYYGGKARIGLWGHDEALYFATSGSKIVIWFEPNMVIEAGFHVFPKLYNNTNDMRFFTFWTTDRFKRKGCYNTRCNGFVVAPNSQMHPGQRIAPLSQYNGIDYSATISIQRDQITGNWNVYRDDNMAKILIGWWPNSLFKNSFNYATRVQWVGFVGAPKSVVDWLPAMGSGHFANEGPNKAAYFKDMKVYNWKKEELDPHHDWVVPMLTKPNCYTVTPTEYANGNGRYFYYGGPNRCH